MSLRDYSDYNNWRWRTAQECGQHPCLGWMWGCMKRRKLTECKRSGISASRPWAHVTSCPLLLLANLHYRNGWIIWRCKPKQAFPSLRCFSRCFATALRQVSLSHPHPVISAFEPLHLQWTLSCQVSCPVCIHSDHAAFKTYETTFSVSLASTTYIPVQASITSILNDACACPPGLWLLSAYIPFISSL